MNNHKHNNFPKQLTRLFSVTIATAAVALTTGCDRLNRRRPIINPNPTRTPAVILPSNTNTIATSEVGATQENPILPTGGRPGVFSFRNVPSRRWYDPPTAYGFRYSMTSASLFTEILDFPTGFNTPFTVAVKNILLGDFTAGQSVKFKDYSNQLGNLLIDDTGVSEFSVTGLNVDPTNPKVFPIKLAFSTETASFDQEAINQVPEPLTCFGGVLGLGAMVAARKRRSTTLD